MSIFGHTKDVGKICENWAKQNQQFTWAQYPYEGNSSLYEYAYENKALPGVFAQTIIACWELPILALVYGGYTDANGVKKIMKPDPLATSINFLIPSVFNGLTTYEHNSTSLDLGHLVFFDGMSHVAILTGEKDAQKNAKVVSFWAHTVPTNTYPLQGPVPNTLVEFNTIEGLQQIMLDRGLVTSPPKVQIAKPVWR